MFFSRRPGERFNRGRVAAGGGFSPLSDPATVIWLDATDNATITTATGVSAWANKADTSLLASVDQATGSKQPTLSTINGVQALNFDGTVGIGASSQELAGTMSAMAQPTTHFVVLESSGISGATTVPTATDSAANRQSVRLDGSGYPMKAQTYAGALLNEPAASIAESTGYILTGVFNGASSAIYRGSTLRVTGNAGADSLSNPIIGRLFLNASGTLKIGEIIICNADIGSARRTAIWNYLSAKWGISL